MIAGKLRHRAQVRSGESEKPNKHYPGVPSTLNAVESKKCTSYPRVSTVNPFYFFTAIILSFWVCLRVHFDHRVYHKNAMVEFNAFLYPLTLCRPSFTTISLSWYSVFPPLKSILLLIHRRRIEELAPLPSLI